MKKYLSLFLALAVLLPVLAGCGQSAPAETQPPAAGSATVQTDAASPAVPQEGDIALPASASTEDVTREKAQTIALDHAGFTANQVSGLRAEKDLDDLIVHYDVEFYQGGYEYDYEIDAKTGEILHWEKDKD